MKNREMSVGTIMSFLSQIINVVSGLIFTPIVIRLLGQAEYGLYQLVLSVVNYLHLMNFGFNGAYIRYYSMAKAKGKQEVKKINGMFFSIFLLLSILCLVAGMILRANIGFLGTQLSTADYVIAKQLMLLMVVNMAISFPNSLFVAYIFANEKFIFYKSITIIINIVLPICKVLVLWFGFGSVGLVWLTLFFSIVQFAVNYVFCRTRLNMQIQLGYFNVHIFCDLLRFTFFIFLSDLVDQMNSNVDKLLLGRMVGTAAVAVYSVAFNLKTYYTIMTWIVPEFYVPKVNRLAIERESDEKLDELFLAVGQFNNYLTLLVISGFVVFGSVFIKLWVGEEYDTAYFATVILMIAGYIPAVQTLGPNIQTAKNKHQLRAVIYFVIACINIIISIILIEKRGIIGACWGTLFAVLIGHGFIMNYLYHRHIGLNIFAFWRRIGRWVPWVCILTCFAWYAARVIHISSWIELIAAIILYVALYLITLFFGELETEEKTFVLDLMKKRKMDS